MSLRERMQRWHDRHHQHDERCAPPFPSRRRSRLRRQLFTWLVLTIFTTAAAVAGVMHLVRPREQSTVSFEQIQRFVGERFGERWEDDARRSALARELSEAFGVSLRVSDAQTGATQIYGAGCSSWDKGLTIRRNERVLGQVDACFHPPFRGRVAALLAIVTAAVVFWSMASLLAFKLTYPLSQMIFVTREIGSGNLKSRARLHRGHRNELSLLAEAINDMAERIERQLSEQRELLAAVSHEVRSPLARLRLSAELLRENPGDKSALDALDYEVSEIDCLVGKLLASSRLDFGTLTKSELSARQVALTALERRKLPAELLEDRSEGAIFSGDATLVARALDNLLDNAEEHGEKPTRLIARRALPGEHGAPGNGIVFEVWDAGKGFAATVLPRAFEPFFRAAQADGKLHASLGLGLSLVQRIATAHGGRAWAENMTNGARVAFSVGG